MNKLIQQILQFVLIGLLPIAILTGIYFYEDPFKVIYKYRSFYESGVPEYVTLNYEYVAFETFIQNYPYWKYNSFILGNSRSRFFEINSWRKYIHTDKAFHFDASSESLYGIVKKLIFLEKKNVEISNILIVMDYSTLIRVDDPFGHLFNQHPALNGESMSDFQLTFFKAYIDPRFLFTYFCLKTPEKIRDFLIAKKLIEVPPPVEYDNKYNEIKLKLTEEQIAKNPSLFYSGERMEKFNLRDTIPKASPPAIGTDQAILFNMMKQIFIRHKTRFSIIISPLYDQIYLNEMDFAFLIKTFGTENIYDFSGVNPITADFHNYYETSHYRPHVSAAIMKQIYENKARVDSIQRGNQ